PDTPGDTPAVGNEASPTVDPLCGWYLVAPLTQVEVDPGVWGLGKQDLLHFQVHGAAERARTHRLRLLFPKYVAGDALHPRTWAQEGAWGTWPLLRSLAAMESEWAEVVRA